MNYSEPIIASTHPPQYLLHKYWARKPHNILAHYIKENFKPGNLLCDPFCGSGVFLAEAKKQGINTIGFDLNPLASLLSSVTLNPPTLDEVDGIFTRIIENTSKKWGDTYAYKTERIRYLVHYVRTKCGNCFSLTTIDSVPKKGNKYLCPKCDSRIYFNFENFIDTKVKRIITVKGIEYDVSSNSELLIEQERIGKTPFDSNNKYDLPLVKNRRILAFPNMKISDLFTKRAFSISSELFDEAYKIKDRRLRNCVLLFLTSNLAQFSKLIPYRNNLNTGGPAWTVPGFWIAPIHLETNPFLHLKARWKKYLSGLEALNNSYNKVSAKSEVKNISMQKGLSEQEDNSIDGMFFDPPYGDNVPYLEFSAIWNAFLLKNIDYESEIIVSDRQDFKSGWDVYESNINSALELMERKLKKRGKIIMTFNNLDPRAWKIILKSFHNHNLKCSSVSYQIPAVISSKAQLANKTSYIGDFYCIFEKVGLHTESNKGVETILEGLLPVFLSRSGKVAKNLVIRTAILKIIGENLSTRFLDSLEEIIFGLAEPDGEFYILRKEIIERHKDNRDTVNLKNYLFDIAQVELSSGKKRLDEFYLEVVKRTIQIGPPDINEVRLLLDGVVLFDNKFCFLQDSKSNNETLPLFVS